ncbi:complement C1q-like protein 4 [Pecten maximus]|uniref:complement C1q-like protein 4 n=1 Tax=Pecten maximus TaxID=6579 RepID=UPI00145883C9|nr:complement C1q-like protein 4 [Pecten maximus]
MNLYLVFCVCFIGPSVSFPDTEVLKLQRELNKQKQRLDVFEKELRRNDNTAINSVLPALLAKRDYEGVAFSATLSVAFDSSGHNKPIPFDTVNANSGNGYSPSTGVFTAPQAGMYMLYTSLSVDGDDALHAELQKNGAPQCACTSTHYGSGSCMVIIPLSVGDKVFVKEIYGRHVRGDHLATFNGWLVL